MRNMINSGIEWLGAIPKNWSLVKAKYIFVEEKGKGTRGTQNFYRLLKSLV